MGLPGRSDTLRTTGRGPDEAGNRFVARIGNPGAQACCPSSLMVPNSSCRLKGFPSEGRVPGGLPAWADRGSGRCSGGGPRFSALFLPFGGDFARAEGVLSVLKARATARGGLSRPKRGPRSGCRGCATAWTRLSRLKVLQYGGGHTTSQQPGGRPRFCAL